MMSSSGESTPDSVEDYEDADTEEHSFENPNYRKLYAALSITSMMGQNNDQNKHCSENQQLIDEQNNGSDVDCNELPIGWERHEDESGPYFWHIPSGTIQRSPPQNEKSMDTKRDSLIYFDNFDENMVFNNLEKNCDSNDIQNASVLTVLVHSLGWMEVDETQLTSATSSKVIQKCIIELSTRGDNNAVRCWGRQTQELVLKVENCCLKLYERSSNTLLNCQPIEGMRVWGVNDNNDFAFVAKDSVQSDCQTSVESNESNSLLPNPSSNGLKCHVFHCEEDDNSAQRIATYLRDELIKLKAQNNPKTTPHNQRPKHLFIYDSSTQGSTVATPTAIEFPTPIEEPRKSINAKYLGKTDVPKPMGIDVLNKAIETILYEETDEKNDSFVKRYNIPVVVHISPSNIIIENKENNECMAECRVRYLSFMGIGSQSVRLCGFIVQIDENRFEAHCFECDPSSGAFCKTIEAACRLRYQKCLDAHRQRLAANNTSTTQPNSSGIKSTIFNVFSKISNNMRKN